MRLFAGTAWDVPPTCDRCGLTGESCRCPPAEPDGEPLLPPERQTARITVEKRKKGKWVTVIGGLSTRGGQLETLLVELKNSLGAGGSIHDRNIEIQGNHVERVGKLLTDRKYRVK
jgi:translation initiation factor 1